MTALQQSAVISLGFYNVIFIRVLHLISRVLFLFFHLIARFTALVESSALRIL